MKDFKGVLVNTLTLMLMADVIILCWMMLAIGSGQQVTHIPFWDTQIRFILSVFNH